MKTKKTVVKGIATMLFMVMAFMVSGSKAYALTQGATSQDAVTVTWQAEKNAKAYYVGIGADYTAARTMAESKAVSVPAAQTSYTFSGLAYGTEYSVYVYYTYTNSSGKEYFNRTDSGTIKTLPGKVTGVNQERWWYWALSCDVKWDKQPGVNGYEYIIKDEKKKTIAQDTTGYNRDGTSFKVKNTIVYNIQVRAYSDINNVRYYGDWSDTAYMFTQPMIDEKKLSVSGGKLRVKWAKVKGVNSYEVFVSTKKESGYKRVGKYKASKTSATISKFKKKKFSDKKTYYVYVMGKKKVGSRTYTSGMLYSISVKGKKTYLYRVTN